MTVGLTTAQTARVAAGLRWTSARLFTILGQWASEADNPSAAVSFATSSRHLGWHVDDLAELVPQTPLLAVPGSAPPTGDRSDETSEPTIDLDHQPQPAAAEALDAIRDVPGTVDRLAIAHRVLLPRLAAQCVAVERRVGPAADAPMARVIGFLLTDLRRDRDDGEVLLGRMLTDADTITRVGERVVGSERQIVAAGGLVPYVGAGNDVDEAVAPGA